MGRLSSLLFRLAVRALSLLSIGNQRRLGRWLGTVVWFMRLDEARATLTNLALCFPDMDDDARRRLARESLEHTAMLFTEAGVMFHWPEPRWRPLTVSMEGSHLLEADPVDHRGVLILVPHFGNWEYLSLILGRYAVTALYDPPQVGALDGVIREARNRAGATMLPIDAVGLLGFYRALAAGGVTALLPDQVPDRRAGVYADFFGQPALTMTFAHRLMRRTDARVVLGAAVRCPGGFSVRFLAMDEDRLRDPDPVVSATAMNEAIEALVRTDPAQYQWEYKRFKRQPRGTGDPYRRRARPGH